MICFWIRGNYVIIRDSNVPRLNTFGKSILHHTNSASDIQNFLHISSLLDDSFVNFYLFHLALEPVVVFQYLLIIELDFNSYKSNK